MVFSAEHIEQLSTRIFDHELNSLRSPAYKEGLRQGVALRLTGTSIDNMFNAGSAEHDAFEAGEQRGLYCTAGYMYRYARENNLFPRLYSDPRQLAERLARGRALANRIISDMQKRGMGEAKLVGSMSRGEIHERSDIDILVIDCGTLDPFYIVGEVVETNCREPGDENIKIDCIALSLMNEKGQQRWLAETTT